MGKLGCGKGYFPELDSALVNPPSFRNGETAVNENVNTGLKPTREKTQRSKASPFATFSGFDGKTKFDLSRIGVCARFPDFKASISPSALYGSRPNARKGIEEIDKDENETRYILSPLCQSGFRVP